MRIMAWVGLLTVLFTGAASAQCPHDGWKVVDYDLEFSLADAPLSSTERDQIYRVIDYKSVHDSFTDQQREEERTAVLSSRVGFINLARDGSRQLLVRGPLLYCGASGNCGWWVFIRSRGQLKLVLDAGGAFLVGDKSTGGFLDIATEWHLNSSEAPCTIHHWNGVKYIETDNAGK